MKNNTFIPIDTNPYWLELLDLLASGNSHHVACSIMSCNYPKLKFSYQLNNTEAGISTYEFYITQRVSLGTYKKDHNIFTG